MLQGRTCFVTGASRGIGRAVSLKLAEYGATLIIHASDEGKLTEVLRTLPINHNQKHFKVIGDFNRREGILNVCHEVKQMIKKLDVIIHNAGIVGTRTKIEEYPVEEFEKVMRVNIKAPFMITQELLPLLRFGENPSLVFVSSRVGQRCDISLKEWGAYSISKFALDGLTWVLADELSESEPKIRVNSVNPGATSTDMRASVFPNEDPNTLPTPEAITPLFVWLARGDVTIHNEQINARKWVNIDPTQQIHWEDLKG